LEKCVGSRVHLVGVSISFEKNFYRLPFTPPSLVHRIGPSARRPLFKAERDETRRELEDVSKKAGITELEWERQRKQLLETIDGKSLDLL
jgi:hypothetical protein